MNIEKIRAVSKMTGVDEFDVANVLISADYFDITCKEDADSVADSLIFFGETYLASKEPESNQVEDLRKSIYKEPYDKRGENE